MPLRILVSSASGKVPLIRALRFAARSLDADAEVIAGDSDPNVLSYQIADEYWVMPILRKECLDQLIRDCVARKISIIVPTRDGELCFWSEHASAFQEVGIEVVISKQDVLMLCIDKLSFSEYGRLNGLPIISSSLSPDCLDCKRYVVKERFGAASKNIGLNLTYSDALLHAEGLESPIFQPFVNGQEISIDAWFDQHENAKGVILRNRNLVKNGEAQITTTFSNPTIETEILDILSFFPLRGHSTFQALIDLNGKVNTIECNPRFGGASTASIAAGLDSFRWSLIEALGFSVQDYPFDRIVGEVRQVRVPYDELRYAASF